MQYSIRRLRLSKVEAEESYPQTNADDADQNTQQARESHSQSFYYRLIRFIGVNLRLISPTCEPTRYEPIIHARYGALV